MVSFPENPAAVRPNLAVFRRLHRIIRSVELYIHACTSFKPIFKINGYNTGIIIVFWIIERLAAVWPGITETRRQCIHYKNPLFGKSSCIAYAKSIGYGRACQNSVCQVNRFCNGEIGRRRRILRVNDKMLPEIKTSRTARIRICSMRKFINNRTAFRIVHYLSPCKIRVSHNSGTP